MADEPPVNGTPSGSIAAVPTRKERRQNAAAARRHGRRNGRRTWGYLLGGAATVALAVGTAAVVTAHHQDARAAVTTTTTTTKPPAAPTAFCPLRGTPAPGGVVPARPALAIKIGNYTGDRPSAGLNQADIVFEEPVEGAITRLVAVFQCQSTPLVGDLRSAREPDVRILSQLSDPIFVHAGGIAPILSLLADAPLTDENILDGGTDSAIVSPPPNRVAPYSTFTSTAAAWALESRDKTPPAPIFAYGPTLPAGSIAGSGGSVHIPFSSTSNVTWTWNPSKGVYLRSYSGVPDILIGGSQTAATNVVVMSVQTYTGPWVENSEGAQEVEVTDTGSGPLLVLRNGVAITGTWSRSSETGAAGLVTSTGVPITLAPGNTWEELVPDGITATTAPIPAAPMPTRAKSANH
jgi:hypothetical protein